jgi:hypothetical protein
MGERKARVGVEKEMIGFTHTGRKASLPMTPPESPWNGPVGDADVPVLNGVSEESRTVLLYVGRM